jgi:hypothetical protein
MASTYAPNTGIELIATGEKSGTWGDVTNTNLRIIDRLTNGVGAIALSGTTHTLTTSDGALSDGQYRLLVLGGSPSGTNTITIDPNDQEKLFFVFNDSGESAIFTQGSGGNVTVADGTYALIYADGGGAAAAVSEFSFIAPVTRAELNILDGATVTTAELNILDGVTATTAEINYNDVTTLGTTEASKVVTADANGDVSFANGIAENVYALSGTTPALDPTNGTIQTWTLSGNSTPTDSLNSGESITLMIDDGTSYTITWPTITWVNNLGVAPTLATSGYTTIIIWKVSTTLYGALVGDRA